MSESSSPIFIIVSALMAVLGIAIVVNITTGFAQDTDTHNDLSEYNSLHQNIVQECERLEDLGSLTFASSSQIELRYAGIELDGDTLTYDPNDNTDRSDERSINCFTDIVNDIDFDDHSNGFIPIGDHTIIIEENNGDIEVSNS